MATITPFLWFDQQAEEAVNYYVSVFPRASVTRVNRCGPAGPAPEGTVLTIDFRLCDQPFIALNGGAYHSFTPALSLFVLCDSQEESNRLFDTLAADGQALSCGWVTDRFGVTWQLVPPGWDSLIFSEDREAGARAMRAMMSQTRLDVAAIRAAHDGDAA